MPATAPVKILKPKVNPRKIPVIEANKIEPIEPQERVEIEPIENDPSINFNKTEKKSSFTKTVNNKVDYKRRAIEQFNNQQYDLALLSTKQLPFLDQLLLKAKIYEKIDIKKAVILYDLLIQQDNSPIEYLLKLAILQDKVKNKEQALYNYKLYQQHNNTENSEITNFIIQRIKSLTPNQARPIYE